MAPLSCFGLWPLDFGLWISGSTSVQLSQRPKTKDQSTIFLVRKGGLEPPHLSVPDPKSGASANSATFAFILPNTLLLGQKKRISRVSRFRHSTHSRVTQRW